MQSSGRVPGRGGTERTPRVAGSARAEGTCARSWAAPQTPGLAARALGAESRPRPWCCHRRVCGAAGSRSRRPGARWRRREFPGPVFRGSWQSRRGGQGGGGARTGGERGASPGPSPNALQWKRRGWLGAGPQSWKPAPVPRWSLRGSALHAAGFPLSHPRPWL